MVRVADALDMAQGRTRIPIEAGQEGIHSISAAAVDEVRIEAGEERPVRIEIELNNSAGIFQVDDLLATKIRGTPLEGRVEVVAEIEGESEKRLLSGFRLVLAEALEVVAAPFLALLQFALDQRGTITRTAKKTITPKQKKVTVLSVVGPASPTPFRQARRSVGATRPASSGAGVARTAHATVPLHRARNLRAPAARSAPDFPRFGGRSRSCENPVNAGDLC